MDEQFAQNMANALNNKNTLKRKDITQVLTLVQEVLNQVIALREEVEELKKKPKTKKED